MRIFSPSRMARCKRSRARSISSRAVGAWSAVSSGWRNPRALAGSVRPRRASRQAIARGTPSSAASAGAQPGGVGSSQRFRTRCATAVSLVVGIESAHAGAALFPVLPMLGKAGGDLVGQFQKLVVPVGTNFVDVQAGIVVETELERARDA